MKWATCCKIFVAQELVRIKIRMLELEEKGLQDLLDGIGE
jgi:hypothetical protein